MPQPEMPFNRTEVDVLVWINIFLALHCVHVFTDMYSNPDTGVANFQYLKSHL